MTHLPEHVSLALRDIDMRSDSDIDILRSTCAYFEASWREEHDTIEIMSLAFLVQMLFAKNKHFCKKALFWPLLTTVALPVEVRSIMMLSQRKRYKRAIDCFFSGLPTYNRFWDNDVFPKRYGDPLHLTLGDRRWPQYWPERKKDWHIIR